MNYFDLVLPYDPMESYGDPRLMVWGLIASVGLVLEFTEGATSLKSWTDLTDAELKASIPSNSEMES